MSGKPFVFPCGCEYGKQCEMHAANTRRGDEARFAALLSTAVGDYTRKRLEAAERLAEAAERAAEGHCPNDRLFCGSCTPLRDALAAYREASK